MIWQSSSWKSARALVRPWPPAPMSAMLTLSLGATKRWPPRTCRGTMVNAAAAVVVARNCRRVGVNFDSMFSLLLSVGWLSDDYQRPHHVVLLVLQNVAMPHVLVTAGARAGWHGE